MAVIELDLEAPPASSPSRPPVHLLRPLGLALTVVLLLTLSGAAPVSPSLWRSLGVIPLAAEESRYELSGDHLYTIDSPLGVPGKVSSWSLDPIRRDWTFATPAMADDADLLYSRTHLVPADGVLLMQGESFATSILDPGTRAVLWTTPGWPTPLGAGRALLQNSHFRPGTEYDLKSGDPGELYWSSSGRPHTEPPLRTTLSVVDIRTGAPSWTSEAPGSVFTAPIDDGSGVLVVAADKVTVLDRDSGRVLRERTMTRSATDEDIAWVTVVGDLLLLRRGPGDEPGTMIAYATDSLGQRWSRPDPPAQGYEADCSGLPCLKDAAGLTVLDPRSGRPAWLVGPDLSLIRRGDQVLEMQPALRRPIRMRDPASGAVQADLSWWNASSATSDPDQPLVVTRIESAGGPTVFGVLPQGRTEVQPLGYADRNLVDCSSDDRFVACPVPGGIEVWAYQV